MGILAWLERKLFLGEVIQDYGVLHQEARGMTKHTTSALLCKQDGEEKLVFRVSAKAFLSASVNYVTLDVTEDVLAKLSQIVEDLEPRAQQRARRTLKPLNRESVINGQVACPLCHGFNPIEATKCQRCGKLLVEAG